MIRRLVIFILLALGAFFFYQKFLASTFQPFFKEKKEKVDFFGIRSPTIDRTKQGK